MIDVHKIWAAAKIPKTEPLDDDKAAELARRLEKAATRYRMANAPRPERERERLKSIRGTAKKLIRLLAESAETRQRLEHDWPHECGSATLRDMRVGCHQLLIASDRTLFHVIDGKRRERVRGGVVLQRAFGSAERAFISGVASAYEAAANRPAGVSRDKYGELIGPFIRFTQETAKQLGIDPPAPDTIEKAIKAKSRRAANMGQPR